MSTGYTLVLDVPATAAQNTAPGAVITHRFDIADAAGSTDITVDEQFRVLGVTVVKTDGAGGAGDTVQILREANAITDAMSLNVPDQAAILPISLDDDRMTIPAAGTLRVTIVDGNAGATDLACEVFVTGVRV